RKIDPPDNEGHATAERLGMQDLGRSGDAGAAQQAQDGFVQGLSHCRLMLCIIEEARPRPRVLGMVYAQCGATATATKSRQPSAPPLPAAGRARPERGSAA